MFKRLMIGLLVVSMAAIWASEAAALWAINRGRWSVGLTTYGHFSDRGATFEAELCGVPPESPYFGDCQVRVKYFCASEPGEQARLQCLQETQAAATRFVVIDRDAIAPGVTVLFGDGSSHVLTEDDTNSGQKARDQREQLPFFEQAVIDGITYPNRRRITLNVGQGSHTGFLTFPVPDFWCANLATDVDGICTDTVEEAAALIQFAGEWNPPLYGYELQVAPGFGVRGPGIHRDQYLSPVPNIRAMLQADFIVGEQLLGVVHWDQVIGDDFLGNWLGVVGLRVLDASEFPMVEFEVMDADLIGQLPLYAQEQVYVATQNNLCEAKYAYVDAPCGEDPPAFVSIPATGVLDDCDEDKDLCKGTVEIVLDPVIGGTLCSNPAYPVYVDSFPVNRLGVDIAFYNSVLASIPDLSEFVLCSEGPAGSNYYLSVVDYPGDPPTCLSQWLLTVNKTGTGDGTVISAPAGIDCGDDCEEYYDDGTMVTLTATPDSCSDFIGWSGEGCSGTGTCTVTMDQDRSVTATFVRAKYTLTVKKVDTENQSFDHGWITSDPSGIRCRRGCTEDNAEFARDTAVTLTVTRTEDLDRWEGDVTGCTGFNPFRCIMDMDRDIQAVFNTLDP